MIGKSIIVISDVHLGMIIGNDKTPDEEKRESQFRDFLESLDFSKISDFILLGDILDFWRHDYLNIVVDQSSHIDKLKEIKSIYTNTNFYYVAGNHDYHLLWLRENGADYPIDIKRSVEIQSKDEVFFFIHGYQFEVLSWNLYKSLSLYEKFCEDMCLVGEDGSRFADNLWKNYLERITHSISSSSSPVRGLSPNMHEIHKTGDSECIPGSKGATFDATSDSVTEEILFKSNKLLAQIESEEAQGFERTQKTTPTLEIPLGNLNTIKEEIKRRVEDFSGKAVKVNEIINNINQLESKLNPLLPPEERIKPRERNVIQLKEERTELSNLKQSIEKYIESVLKLIKELSEPLYREISNYYEWIHGLVIQKDYFTIKDVTGSDVRHYMFGIKKDQYLIYGHTHDAYIDKDKKVANTGCWGLQTNAKDKEFLYMEILDDEVKIISFIDKDSGSKEWKP